MPDTLNTPARQGDLEAEALGAGREMDQAIQERVFGKCPHPLPHDAKFSSGVVFFCKVCGQEGLLRLPPYSTRIEAAFKVIEKLLDTPCLDGDHFLYRLQRGGAGHVAIFHHHFADGPGPESEFAGAFWEWFEASASTAPLAICRAALLAVGVAVPEETNPP